MSRTMITHRLASAATAVVLTSLVACASGDAAVDRADSAGGIVASATTTGDGAQGTLSCSPIGSSLDEARSRPSPLGEVRFSLGGDEALLCYGRPSANERKVMGGLVPYGEPWRLGANEATAIHLPFAADIGGVAVQPGSYSLYAVPGETEWEIHVNRQVDRWGIPIGDAVTTDDVGSFTSAVTPAPSKVEQFELTWVPESESAGKIVVQWENARVEIPVRRTAG